MNGIFTQVIGGIVLAVILRWLGLNNSSRVIANNRNRKTGKWIMVISGIIIYIGLIWGGKEQINYHGTIAPGYGLAITGLFTFYIGKFIAWWQRS